MSTINLIARKKFRLMPGRESVTYRQQTAVGTYTNSTVADAWSRSLSDKEKAASRGVYVEFEKSWFVPKDQYSTQPMPGDIVLNSDSESYTVLSIEDAGGEGVWKLRAVNLTVAANLRQLVTILAPTNGQDGFGNRVPTYIAAYTDVPARIQPLGGTRDDVQDKLGIVRRYNCFLSQQVDVTAEYQLTYSSVTYQIKGVTNPERIDELTLLELERLP